MPFDTHSTKNLPHLAILEKFKVFFRKMEIISQREICRIELEPGSLRKVGSLGEHFIDFPLDNL